MRAVKLASMPGRTPLRSKTAVQRATKMMRKTCFDLLDELQEEGLITPDDSGAYHVGTDDE